MAQLQLSTVNTSLVKRSDGFTIIEVVVVITVIFILSTFAVKAQIAYMANKNIFLAEKQVESLRNLAGKLYRINCSASISTNPTDLVSNEIIGKEDDLVSKLSNHAFRFDINTSTRTALLVLDPQQDFEKYKILIERTNPRSVDGTRITWSASDKNNIDQTVELQDLNILRSPLCQYSTNL